MQSIGCTKIPLPCLYLPLLGWTEIAPFSQMLDVASELRSSIPASGTLDRSCSYTDIHNLSLELRMHPAITMSAVDEPHIASSYPHPHAIHADVIESNAEYERLRSVVALFVGVSTIIPFSTLLRIQH